MPQSLTQIYLHIVFSTKDRKPFLTDKDFRGRTYSYLAGLVDIRDAIRQRQEASKT